MKWLDREKQNLEFLGDCVARMATAELLYGKKPLFVILDRLSNNHMAACVRKHNIDVGEYDDVEVRFFANRRLGSLYEVKLGKIFLSDGYEVAREFVKNTLIEDVEIEYWNPRPVPSPDEK